MKNKKTPVYIGYTLSICISLLLSSVVKAQTFPPDLLRLRKQFVAQAMEPAVHKEAIEKILQTFRSDSTWTGIDYTNFSREAFEHRRHLTNLEQLCRAYRKKGSPYRNSKRVRQVIDKALAFWVENDFLSENWYSNEIGTPESLSRILLIMDESLTAQQIEGILPIAGRAHINAWGARPSGDRIKIAGIQAKVAFFNYDLPTIEMLIGVIESEIKFSSGVGLKRDYSFQHRTDGVNNTLHYGLNYANTFAEWADMLAGTSYAFSEGSVRLLIDFYLDGICKQMVYGRMRDMGILNRDISRKGESNVFSAKVPRQLSRVSTYRREELENIIRARGGASFKKESFAHHYWLSDHFVFQSPLYYSSVRMFSERIRNMEEPYNGEGFYNHFRGDGANHIAVTGEEYKDIAPFFDWRKVPGATILNAESMPPENELQKQGFTSFVGAVTDGTYGAAGFDFISPHEPLRARKAWFFFEEGYICLGAGIQSRLSSASTTVNQCLLNSPVAIKSEGEMKMLAEDTEDTISCEWVLHDRVGYYFPVPTTLSVSNRKRSGRFSDISRQAHASKELLETGIFKLWINHSKPIRQEGYQYIVLPDMNPGKLEQWIARNTWEVLANTREMQAVYAGDKEVAYGIFYSAGELQPGEKNAVESDHPGMILIHYEGKQVKSITVSDPTHQLARFHLSLTQPVAAGAGYHVQWDPATAKSHLTIDLPQGEYKGKSVTIHCR